MANIDVRDPNGGADFVRQRFLLFDSGRGNDRILIFGTDATLLLLEAAGEWYADGTFKVNPILFRQLLTVHIKYPNSNNVLPCLYALLPNKTENTYTRLFQAVTFQFSYDPSQILDPKSCSAS